MGLSVIHPTPQGVRTHEADKDVRCRDRRRSRAQRRRLRNSIGSTARIQTWCRWHHIHRQKCSLQASGGTIECTSDTVSGELTGPEAGTATITFKSCSAFTIFGAKSLDAKNSGEIIAHVKLLLCYINKANKEVGVLTEVTKPVHVEVSGKLIEIIGDAVGAITPINKSTTKFNLVYKQKGGTQEPAGCEGKTENLLAKENEAGEFKNAGEQTTEETEFTIAQTLSA
jgi:hypothetical protein